MADLLTEFLFEISVTMEPPQVVGPTPNGDRRIRYIKGGSFSGPKLQGEVLPGGADWLLLRPDGARSLDVRLTLRTEEGHLIYVVSRGILDISAENYQRIAAGEEIDATQYYFRTTPLFEASAEKLDWLNRVVAVTRGRLTKTTVEQRVYAVL
ncbi:MAG TPA: DUF3237 domain-containing protein [Thermoanaerobaculia bacterium]|nr:DUF3237 domain-containing protein [Thermoanaerobaculia bacterium]